MRIERKSGLALAVLLALAAAPELIHAGYAASEKSPARAAPKPTAAAFKPSCLANALADTRPDPAWVSASYERDACVAPVMPQPPDGAGATREKIVAAMARMKDYSAAADGFQQCIARYLADRRAQALHSATPMPAWLPILENHRILAAQKNKERGESLMRSSIEAFNAPGSECADHG